MLFIVVTKYLFPLFPPFLPPPLSLSTTSTYLAHIISNDHTRDSLLNSEAIQLKVCVSWLRCVLYMHTPPSCVQEVNQLTQ